MLRKLAYASLFGGALIAFPVLAQTAADPFVKDQMTNQWRASKLVGVNVMGAEQKKIGSIEDVLLDHDGAAQVVVIGVGGFLGIGEKSVAVPFKTLTWRTEGRAVAVNTPPAMASGNTDAPNNPAVVKTDPAATEASQGYPDMAMLDMTKAQLEGAPDFHYAPIPADDTRALAPPPPLAGAATQKPAGPAPAN